MTCRRAYEADLLALVHGEGDAELRLHVEGCADCTAELRVWRELDGLLQAGVAPPESHPAPEELVAFVDAPASLASDARARLERHLAACRPCADEVRGLGSFVPVPSETARDVAAADARAAGAQVAAPRAPLDDDARAPGRVARVLWHPAFAYALVVLLLVPLVRDQIPKLSYETRAIDERRTGPPLAPPGGRPAAPAPAARPGAGGGAPADLARARAEADASRVAAGPGREDAPRPPAVALADRMPGRQDEQPAVAAGRAAGETTSGLEESHDGGGPAARRKENAAPEMENAKALAAPAPPPPASAVASAPSGNDAAPQAAAPRPGLLVLDLLPQRPTVYGAEVVGRPAQLRIGPPQELARGPLTVTVRGRTNRREVVALGVNEAKAIVIAIPSDWLAPGDYVVTLQPLQQGAEPAAPPALLGFSVRAPTAR